MKLCSFTKFDMINGSTEVVFYLYEIKYEKLLILHDAVVVVPPLKEQLFIHKKLKTKNIFISRVVGGVCFPPTY